MWGPVIIAALAVPTVIMASYLDPFYRGALPPTPKEAEGRPTFVKGFDEDDESRLKLLGLLGRFREMGTENGQRSGATTTPYDDLVRCPNPWYCLYQRHRRQQQGQLEGDDEDIGMAANPFRIRMKRTKDIRRRGGSAVFRL